MNTRFLAPAVFAAGILIAAAPPAPAKVKPPVDPVASAVKPSTVEREVRQMFEDYFKTVERHELKNFLAFFAAGEDLTVFEDKEMYDWKGFVVFAEGFFQQVAEIKFDHEKCTVNPIGPGVAVATGVFRAAGKTTSGEPVAIRNSYTFVLLKQGDRWRIKHVHESSL
jgi:uncharacterized protein (TIGR02246 family)